MESIPTGYDAQKCLHVLQQREIFETLLIDIQNDTNNVANIQQSDDDHSIKLKVREWLSTNNKLLLLKNEICKILLSSANTHSKNQQQSTTLQYKDQFAWKAAIPEIPTPEEPLDIVATARNQWDKRLRYQVRTLSVQQKRPLIQKQSTSDNASDTSSEVLSLRYIYTCEDLLETLANIHNANNQNSAMLQWGLIKLDLHTPNLHELRMKFKELHPRYKHLGVDDCNTHNKQNNQLFLQHRLQKGRQYLENAYIPQLREYAKFGIPPGIRTKMWNAMIVTVNNDDNDTEEEREAYFNRLLDSVDDTDMITDCLYRLDVDQTVDHQDFFPFDDFLNDIMLAFSRDSAIPNMTGITLNTALLINHADDHTKSGEQQIIPPCHVIPFHQQTLLCAPLGFLYEEPKNAYFMFRKLFCRFFCKLHVISSARNTILSLCKVFECLLSYLYPSLFFHCVNHIGIQPLTIAFPWIFTGFASYLKNEEVLNIWDRMIAYDDDGLLLLPVICVAIFHFRKDNLFACDSKENLHLVFQDLRTIKVIPLLQHFLFTAK